MSKFLIKHKKIISLLGVIVGGFLILSLCLTSIALIAHSGNQSNNRVEDLEAELLLSKSEVSSIQRKLEKSERNTREINEEMGKLRAAEKTLIQNLNRTGSRPFTTCTTKGALNYNSPYSQIQFDVPSRYDCISIIRKTDLKSLEVGVRVREDVNISTSKDNSIKIHVSTPDTAVPSYGKLDLIKTQNIRTKDDILVTLETSYFPDGDSYFFEVRFGNTGTKIPTFSVWSQLVPEKNKEKVEKDIIELIESIDFSRG